MGEHNITNESLAFSMVLVLIAIVVSYREKLGLEKDIVWSICRAVIHAGGAGALRLDCLYADAGYPYLRDDRGERHGGRWAVL